ncbi:MAG: NAD-dependent malic enzyme [Chlamydiae bacterium]|nr:NAD-dependent malic enzyme [Chlamydiota bacterium]
MKKEKTDLTARQILEDPLFNKGTAFTEEERQELGLTGLLPFHVSTIEEQLERRYANFLAQPNEMAKFTFLSALQNRNETLFYRLVSKYVNEMVPLIYTPTVGDVSINYSMLYHEQRGLYISYPHRDRIEEIVNNFPRQDIDVIVVTDGERILGLGDLGVGGMAIPVGKLALYTLFGGIHPAKTLPIVLDVGTNNQKMLEDPLYIGWRNSRIDGKEYNDFIDAFVSAIKKRYPEVLFQWEDFAKPHARPLLDRYRKSLCSFNDDIQGTASVALAAAYSAIRLSGTKLKDQRIVLLGGGSAGIGICTKILQAIVDEGELSEEEARRLFYVVDRSGLLHTGLSGLDTAQKPFAQPKGKLNDWKVQDKNKISLLEVVQNAHPTILIGVSTSQGAFTEEIVKTMAQHTKRPVIFPLSNPTIKCEAHPSDLIKWTNGEAIIATGSPFDPVAYEGNLYHIAQCNNVYVFPGIGLGLIACKASYASDQVFIQAAKVLSTYSPMLKDPYSPLFPTLDVLRKVTREIGITVAKTVIEEGNAQIEGDPEQLVDAVIWHPEYPIYVRPSN